MRFGFLTFLIVSQLSFAGVTASSKPAQVVRPPGAPTVSAQANEVVFKPQPPRNRSFLGDGIPHAPTKTVQSPADNFSNEEDVVPVKPLRSPFGNKTVKESSW